MSRVADRLWRRSLTEEREQRVADRGGAGASTRSLQVSVIGGVPLEDVQRLGRWASSKMLLELYSGSDENRLRAAADAVGKARSE